MIEVTDHCGIVSGRKADKSVLFEVFYVETKTAPMIRQCPLCIECKLIDIHDLPTNAIYIGEVVAAYAEKKYLTEDKPDVKKMNSAVLTVPENRYWRVGEDLGQARRAGKKLGRG
jgi:flavin reductase (DIM6/NTAB) family NADH-FMN oxidoreductase RutF